MPVRPVSFVATAIGVEFGVDASPYASRSDGERSLLRDECLERGEVAHSGICLDLTEVRIHRRVERDVWCESDLHIAADRHLLCAVKAGARYCALQIARHGVRRDFEASRTDDASELRHLTTLRHETVRRW